MTDNHGQDPSRGRGHSRVKGSWSDGRPVIPVSAPRSADYDAVRPPHVLGDSTRREETRWLGTDPEDTGPVAATATSAPTCAPGLPITPATTSASSTRHGEHDAGSGDRPRVIPPGKGVDG